MDALEQLVGVCHANGVVGYFALWNMMSYLTQVFGLKLTVAAAIINIWTASSKLLQIFMSFLADAFLGYFLVLLFSNIAFSFGICLVLYTTPQVYFHFNNKKNAPSTLGCYSKEFAEGVMGVGIGLSSFFIQGVGKLRQIKGNPNWFQEGIDQSRLDIYFSILVPLMFVLAIASSCNCCYDIKLEMISYQEDDHKGRVRRMKEQRKKKMNAEKEWRPVDEYYAIKFRKGELTFREKYELHLLYWHCLAEDERKELKSLIEPAEYLKDNTDLSEPLLQ